VRNSGLTAVKATLGGFGGSFQAALDDIARYQRIIEEHPATYRQVRTIADIASAKSSQQLGVLFSFESATRLEGRLDRIDLFRNLGVRVMQLSYNDVSPFGAGIPGPSEGGLTSLGAEAVRRMNEVGVTLDLSHSNPATTSGALAVSAKPVLNKTDEQLRMLAEKGSEFGIFDLFYLTPSPRQPNLTDYMGRPRRLRLLSMILGETCKSGDARIRWEMSLTRVKDDPRILPGDAVVSGRLPSPGKTARPDVFEHHALTWKVVVSAAANQNELVTVGPAGECEISALVIDPGLAPALRWRVVEGPGFPAHSCAVKVFVNDAVAKISRHMIGAIPGFLIGRGVPANVPVAEPEVELMKLCVGARR
jgi:hypothetical protein